MNRRFILAALLTLGLLDAGPVFAADRPHQAQDALNRGFAMAQQQQWPLAIKYFRQAQQAAPKDAAILFNLALATDKAGGRDLPAYAWYQAFLAVAPTAGNAAQVRKRLTDLDIAAESQVQKLLDTAQEVANQLPTSQDPGELLARLARAQAENGDLGAAQATVARLRKPALLAWPLAQIAAAQAAQGNIDQARTGAQAIQAKGAKAWALAEIAVQQAKQGDFAGALRDIDAIGAAPELAWALSRIGVLQARAGDTTGAEATLARIDEKRNAERAMVQAAIAGPLAKGGSPDAVRKAAEMLDKAEAAARAEPDFRDRLAALAQVAKARADAGDPAGAEKLANGIPDGPERYKALRAIAQATGDIGGADACRWTALAIEAESRSGSGDINALLKSAQGQSALGAGIALAQAAEDRARLIQRFRAGE